MPNATPAPDISVVFPVYDNQAIAAITLPAIRDQRLPAGITHEVVVIDDGSGPATRDWAAAQAGGPVRVIRQPRNSGRSAARNAGFAAARGRAVVFLDSDVTVVPGFLAAHAAALGLAPGGGDLAPRIALGRVVDSYHVGLPPGGAPRLRGLPHFTTANSAMPRALLAAASETPDGPFDAAAFTQYGWEDLELERRLLAAGGRRTPAPAALGFHHCPPFTLAQYDRQIAKEVERAAMARVFLAKHPTLPVRLMVQATPLHRALWWLCSLGGVLTSARMRPLIGRLIDAGRGPLAETVARLTVFNPTYMRHL
jgi:GT2 family glycosyltransferase